MATATGKRLGAALCFLIGGGTVILAPILWPIGYKLIKQAKQAEEKAEKEAELIDKQLENVDHTD